MKAGRVLAPGLAAVAGLAFLAGSSLPAEAAAMAGPPLADAVPAALEPAAQFAPVALTGRRPASRSSSRATPAAVKGELPAWRPLAAADAVPAASADPPRLVDGADLLDVAEEAALQRRLDEISAEHGAEVVVVTVDSLGGRSAQAFADDYFDYGPDPSDQLVPGRDVADGYGADSGRSGILLLVAVQDREWALSTSGDSISVFTDAELDRIENRFRPSLSDGRWAEAFTEFTDSADKAYVKDAGGLAAVPWGMVALVAALAALVGGFTPVILWLRQLKSVRPAVGARGYISSANLMASNDVLVSQNTAVIDTSSQNRGGGSSTHTGSSGFSHGGSSGRF